MSRIGVQALKWPFTSKEVEKLVASLESYEQIYTLALLTDQTWGFSYFLLRRVTDRLYRVVMRDCRYHYGDVTTSNNAYALWCLMWYNYLNNGGADAYKLSVPAKSCARLSQWTNRDVSQKMNLVDKKTDKLHQKIDFAKLPIAKGASFDAHLEEHNTRCLTNTRVVLQRQIKEWAKDGTGKPIFWLNGMAGTGKSTIARTIAQSFADEGQLGASFFFQERGGRPWYCKQVLHYYCSKSEGSCTRFDIKHNESNWCWPSYFRKGSKGPVWEVDTAATIGNKTGFSKCIGTNHCNWCIRRVRAKGRYSGDPTTPCSNKEPWLNFVAGFVTSRPDLPIRLGFKQMLDGTYQDLILHNIPKVTIENDIAIFLEHELRVVSKQRSLPLGWPSKEQIQALVQMAIPLFIFASTACRYIGDERDNPKKRLEIFLQYQTTNQVSRLDKTYLPILNHLFDDEDELDKERQTSEIREVVGSIIVLESPLSIPSLAHLLNIPKGPDRKPPRRDRIPPL